MMISHIFYYKFRAIRATIIFFFFNDTATTEIYTLSLHDALPISENGGLTIQLAKELKDLSKITLIDGNGNKAVIDGKGLDRKSTRLNSSHANISYAVFCLKKKKKKNMTT